MKSKNKCPNCGHELCLRADEVRSFDILEDGGVSTKSHAVSRSSVHIHCGGCNQTSLDDVKLKKLFADLQLWKKWMT